MSTSPPMHQYRMSASPERSISEQEFSDEPWKSLAKIVRDVGPTLSPDEELGNLAAAEAAVNAKDTERTAVVDKARDELRQLSRQLAQASSAAQRPSSHPTAVEHEEQVRQLEQKQYTVGKQLNEEQSLVSKKEVELGKLKLEKQEVEKINIGEEDEDDGKNDWMDGKIIRLKILSESGFSLVPSKDNKSADKILIRNDLKDDVHSVPIDNSRSKVYTANLIWNLASEGC
ncbi:hypothetical protein I302_103390 [Kwoniella bestiolae CBS 10118]|uniref:Kinetochore protein Spc24 n=1 Tax=Kwoniella bestiolae CBS 10118 TaxID=1296100 RepID=A0A1B9G8D4_9TREE|nr:kinetochore protein Spc24 [Kwoniella bestiolae CBS 10118]OCF27251.1 kinetochore protein Spc24 [Kwoniella bestiolae CBS 10118]